MRNVKVWTRGLAATVILLAGACGDDGGSDSDGQNDGGVMGSTTGADTGGTSGGTSGGGPTTGGTNGSGTTGGTGSTTGGGTTGGTTGSGTSGGTTGGGTTSGTTGGNSTGTTGGTGGSTTGSQVACSSAAESACDFVVTVATKNATHPWNGMGFSAGYLIGGVQGKALSLKRGTAYTFLLKQACSHPLYLTTSDVGNGPGSVTAGVSLSGTPACSGVVLTFTPSAGTPNTLYYQCDAHDKMGGTITVSN